MQSQTYTEELKQKMLSHGNFKQDNIAEHYDELSSHYEDIYLMVGYHDPLKCAELTKEIFGDATADKVIFDMGCGTGLVGQYLKERGFTNVVGVDASKGMLEKAREKQAYTELEELFLGRPDTFPEKYRNRFDAITAAGILAEGHLDNKLFDEMILALKTGGYAIFATRTEYLTKYNYAEGIQGVTDRGLWKQVKEIKFWRYDQAQEAVGRFTKTEITGYIYQKL